MSSNDKVKELYSQAFERAIAKPELRAITLIAVKYARFLAFKCHDVQKACDVMEKAINTE